MKEGYIDFEEWTLDELEGILAIVGDLSDYWLNMFLEMTENKNRYSHETLQQWASGRFNPRLGAGIPVKR